MPRRQRARLVFGAALAALSLGCKADNFGTNPKGGNGGCASSGTLTLGAPATGDLSRTGCKLSDGTTVQHYVLTLTQPTAVDFSVDATGDSFDPVLILYRSSYTGDDAWLAWADNDPADLSSYDTRLHTVLSAGTYVIGVNHWADEPTSDLGPYTLRAAAGTGSADFCWDPSTFLPALWMTPGTSADQTLSDTDCTLDAAATQFSDYVGLYLKSGESVTITANSLGLDTQLELYDETSPDPVKVGGDVGGSLDAQLSYTAPGTGVYYLLVTSPARAMGEYSLSVTSGLTTAPVASAAARGAPVVLRQAPVGARWMAWMEKRGSGRAKSAR